VGTGGRIATKSLVGMPVSSEYWTKFPVRQSSDRVDLDHGLLMRRGRHHDDAEGTEASEARPTYRRRRQVRRPSLPSHHKWSMPMWILMYVFSYSVSPAATNDRAEWRLLPTVVFQEFSNEERCKAAKSTLEGSLKEAGAKLKSGLEDLKSIGKADPAQIIIAFNVECLPK
jgi:hypothetical protein